MAKAKTTEKKKKKSLVQRMMFGNDNKPDLTPEQMQMSAWGMFKYLFFRRFGTMVALNLLTLLFALPAIAVILLTFMNVTISNSMIGYSSNLFVGYPVVIDAVQQGRVLAFNYEIFQYALLVPCIAVFALGVGGNLYVMRKLIWEEPTRTFKDFFRGIKKCWLSSLFIGIAFGLTLLLFMFTIGYFETYEFSVALRVICTILACIMLVFMTLFTAFFITQNAAFKMRPMVLIKNSILFVLGTNIQSILFVGIAIAPALLALIPGITMLLTILYVFLGFSFTALVLTVYCHSCYKKFLYNKVDGAPTPFVKRGSDIDEESASQQTGKKKSPVPYKNPKKRKKSIDEGSSITPLTPMFRREDLARLEKEHEQVMLESNEDEYGEADGSGAEIAEENVRGEHETENVNYSTEVENGADVEANGESDGAVVSESNATAENADQ